MARSKFSFRQSWPLKRNQLGLALIVWLLTALVLSGCGDEPRPPVRSQVDLPGDPTATPPFPARGGPTTPTPTSDAARAFDSPPPLFPTNTPLPSSRPVDATATAGFLETNLTPTAVPTGQLAYVQAGNLWLIDDTGSNRRQLTDSADIGSDSVLSWSLARDRLVYVSRAAELWTVDLQGKRTLVFSATRSARLSAPAKLPPLPTVPQPETTTPRPNPPTPTAAPVRSGLQISSPVWSPDGRYVAFNFYAGESGLLAGSEVWIADLLTEKIILKKVGDGFGPGWSPDSRTLAYLSRGETRAGAPRPTINLTPPGTSLLPVTRGSNAEAAQPPAATTPPGPSPAALTPSPSQVAASPTSFIIRPGSTLQPSPNGSPSATPAPTPTPTPTLNLVALPSPTPTPTYPPVYLGSYAANKLLLYTVANGKTSTLLDSDKLPEAFIDVNNLLRSYVPVPLQAAWWSPDGRYIAFADRVSVVGVLAITAGSSPVIWTGLPQGYAVYDLDWLPRSDGVFYRFNNPYGDDSSRVALVTFSNVSGNAGASGDVTNRSLIKINILSGTQVSCPSLSPGGNYFSYYDGAVLVITRPDGSVVSSYSDSTCPAWSPFGRTFATIRKNSDGTIVLNSLDQAQPRLLLSARAVERVYWIRSDPSYLGGQPPVGNPVAPTALANPLTPRP